MDSLAQGLLKVKLIRCIPGHGQLKYFKIIPPSLLGVVHSNVGLLDKRHGLAISVAGDADADAGRDFEIPAAQVYRFTHNLEYFGCTGNHSGFIVITRHHDHKLITAPAANGISFPGNVN